MEEAKNPAIRYLPEGYEPSPLDVLCGRGRKCYFHEGNVRFRDIVQAKLAKYSAATTKMEKGGIISEVHEEICEQSGVGGFVKKDENNRWYDVGEFLAREKVSQAFRDALQDKYKSSTVSKKKRREMLLQSAERNSQRSLVSGHSQRSLDPGLSQRNLFSTFESSQASLCSELTLDDLERIAMQNVQKSNCENTFLLDLLDGDIRQAFGPQQSRWEGYNHASFRGVDEMPVTNRRQQMMQAYSNPSPEHYQVNKSCPVLAWQGSRAVTSTTTATRTTTPTTTCCTANQDEDYEPLHISHDSTCSLLTEFSSAEMELHFIED